MTIVCGWDIGGVHLKGARLDPAAAAPTIDWRQVPFEIWRSPDDLAERLRALALDLGLAAGSGDVGHAVTMTAELSDVFAGREAGVRFILDACRRVLTGRVLVLDLGGHLLPIERARADPTRVAAANWMASATIAARALGAAGLFIDVGSTTTDIVPLDGGRPAPRGRTDRERLASGELVYTGLLRTPPAALADRVPLAGGWCRTAPEQFTIMGDVQMILGRIRPEEYSVPTPDGRGRGREECAARLARLVCSAPEDLGADALEEMARFLADRQVNLIAGAVSEVAAATPGARRAVVAGIGAGLAAAAARRAGLDPIGLAALRPGLGNGWDRAAPAAALALLLADGATGDGDDVDLPAGGVGG